MGELKGYFFDSYALFEIVLGNKNYNPYLDKIAIATTKLNLMELHYGLLKIYGKDIADRYYDYFSIYCIDFEDGVIKKANEFKLSLKSRKFSYIDALGYVIAKANNLKFLTGDIQFKDLDNVEFVK